MPRLFVGLDLPDHIKDTLIDLSEEDMPGARWSGFDRFHITLCFVGEISHRQADDVDDAMKTIRHPSFELSLSRTGYFGDRRRARILWAGLPTAPLLHGLQGKIRRLLPSIDIEVDHRKYRPHVTLARCQGLPVSAAQDYVNRYEAFKTESFQISEFCLFSSHLAQEGAHYRIEATYPLEADHNSKP